MTKKFNEEYKCAFTGTLIKLFTRFKEIELIIITEYETQIREHDHRIMFCSCGRLKKTSLAAGLRFECAVRTLDALAKESYDLAYNTLRIYANYLESVPHEVAVRYPFSTYTIRKLAGELLDFMNTLERAEKKKG